MDKKILPSFRALREWSAVYGHKEVPDDRAVQDFVLCESREAINSLRNELISLKNGLYDHAAMETFLGKRRLAKFNSFKEWAVQMLLWLAEHEKRG